MTGYHAIVWRRPPMLEDCAVNLFNPETCNRRLAFDRNSIGGRRAQPS